MDGLSGDHKARAIPRSTHLSALFQRLLAAGPCFDHKFQHLPLTEPT